jgi:hypothetical protein
VLTERDFDAENFGDSAGDFDFVSRHIDLEDVLRRFESLQIGGPLGNDGAQNKIVGDAVGHGGNGYSSPSSSSVASPPPAP